MDAAHMVFGMGGVVSIGGLLPGADHIVPFRRRPSVYRFHQTHATTGRPNTRCIHPHESPCAVRPPHPALVAPNFTIPAFRPIPPRSLQQLGYAAPAHTRSRDPLPPNPGKDHPQPQPQHFTCRPWASSAPPSSGTPAALRPPGPPPRSTSAP